MKPYNEHMIDSVFNQISKYVNNVIDKNVVPSIKKADIDIFNDIIRYEKDGYVYLFL